MSDKITRFLESLYTERPATRTIRIPVGSEVVTVEFYPERLRGLTPQITAFAASKPPQFERLIAILHEVLASWDLTEADVPMPITFANLARLPVSFLIALLVECGDNAQ